MRFMGMLAMGILLFMFLSALRPLRRRFFRLFAGVHFLGITGLLVVLPLHDMRALPWCVAAGCVLVNDFVWRVGKTKKRRTS